VNTSGLGRLAKYRVNRPEPTKAEVDKHFAQQERSIFVPPRHRDPGVTIAHTKAEVERQLGAAMTGQTAHAFRLRNASEPQPDPLARMCSLVKAAHEGMPADEFRQLVQTPIEQQAYLALYGDMKDHQRAAIWDKINKGVFEAQQAALQEAHRAHQRDAKRTDQLLKGRALQERIAQHAAKSGKVADAE
jgi:hypothetical protein